MNNKVTILMSVYNGERFLREAIDSILGQTFKDFEFVVYDDCSTDSTPEIIKSYKDSRIAYRRNDTNKGLTHNLADGVAKSDSEFIVRMDADDIAYPQRIEKQVAWMREHPEISIMGTSVTYFSKTPGDGGLAPQPQDDAIIKATLFISFTLMHPSIIIRRNDLVKHRLNYNPEYRYSQDHALYFDCIRVGLKFANMPEPLLYMRGHEASISRHSHSAQQECSKRIRSTFLNLTGIGADCSDEEIEVYNNMSSNVYPDSIEKVHAYECFVTKVCSNGCTSRYFDKDILLRLMSSALCDGAYFAIDCIGLKKSAIEARKSVLINNCRKWEPYKMLKFMVKRIIR